MSVVKAHHFIPTLLAFSMPTSATASFSSRPNFSNQKKKKKWTIFLQSPEHRINSSSPPPFHPLHCTVPSCFALVPSLANHEAWRIVHFSRRGAALKRQPTPAYLDRAGHSWIIPARALGSLPPPRETGLLVLPFWWKILFIAHRHRGISSHPSPLCWPTRVGPSPENSWCVRNSRNITP